MTCIYFEARFRTEREPLMTSVSVRSTCWAREDVVAGAPGFDSIITASNVRFPVSRGSAVASFAVVMVASAKIFLNWVWMSGSLLSKSTLMTEEESVMKTSPEEEGRIIAQSRFEVNEEIAEASAQFTLEVCSTYEDSVPEMRIVGFNAPEPEPDESWRSWLVHDRHDDENKKRSVAKNSQ